MTLLSPKDLRRDRLLRKKYGITLEQFEAILSHQHGQCGICREFLPGKKRMFVDHDHTTGAVRGILCWTCNYRLLGRGLDRPELHERAGAYLRAEFKGRDIATA